MFKKFGFGRRPSGESQPIKEDETMIVRGEGYNQEVRRKLYKENPYPQGADETMVVDVRTKEQKEAAERAAAQEEPYWEGETVVIKPTRDIPRTIGGVEDETMVIKEQKEHE